MRPPPSLGGPRHRHRSDLGDLALEALRQLAPLNEHAPGGEALGRQVLKHREAEAAPFAQLSHVLVQRPRKAQGIRDPRSSSVLDDGLPQGLLRQVVVGPEEVVV